MKNPPPEKTIEARIAEAERYITRLRVGLIAVASLIIWQATSAMGYLGPVRLYVSEVYASRYVLEDGDQKVHARLDFDEEGRAFFAVFGPDQDYARVSAQGVEERLESGERDLVTGVLSAPD